MDKFVIIDGNSLINRAFYALPMLSNFDGEISNGVFGFTTILCKIITEIKPKYLTVAFDYGKKTFRNDLYENYKGTRKPTPPELISQFPILKLLLTKMGIKYIEQKGIEADDIIGTLTKKFDTENIIVTGDKDSFQLINKNTWVMFTKKGVTVTENYNEQLLMETYNLKPFQIIELKSLMGDTADNIPGVKGIGEKTAVSLLNQYETLDGVYEHIDEVKGKLKENLINDKDVAYLSKELATINTNCNIDCKLSDFAYNFPFDNNVLDFFKKYQFHSLIKRSDLFLIEENNISIENNIETKKIDSLDILDECINNIDDKIYLVFDDMFSIFNGKTEYYLDNNFDLLTPSIELEDVLNKLKSVFESKQIEKCVYDLKGILHKLNKFNLTIKNVTFDVLIARYLINNNLKSNVGFLDIINENLLDNTKLSSNLYQLEKIYNNKLNELELKDLFNKIEMPLTFVLFEMEKEGFKIDKDALLDLDKKYSEELEVLTNTIYELAGEEFNINSPKQLGIILFDKLGLSAYNNKKKSTSVEVLLSIQNQHPIINEIIRYRKISKLYTTYIKAFQNLIDEETSKIHTVFNQTLTATGRLSSSEPNLQNIPVRNDDGKNLRKIFIPSFNDGYIVSADYSQIELRLMAAFSMDPTMLENYKQNKDIHATTASQVFGVELKDVTDIMRRDAKAINFGIIYGISDYGLSQNINTTRKIAKDYITKYFEKYPLIKVYMDKNVEKCKNDGYIKTMFGRIRYIPEIKSSNFNVRQFGERAAMNMPLQGSASDIIKLAMIKVFNEFKKQNLQSKLILQIHDELIVDCEKTELNKVITILNDCMTTVVDLPVKLEVNINYGKNWFEA